jgi:hypothetical protein
MAIVHTDNVPHMILWITDHLRNLKDIEYSKLRTSSVTSLLKLKGFIQGIGLLMCGIMYLYKEGIVSPGSPNAVLRYHLVGSISLIMDYNSRQKGFQCLQQHSWYICL